MAQRQLVAVAQDRLALVVERVAEGAALLEVLLGENHGKLFEADADAVMQGLKLLEAVGRERAVLAALLVHDDRDDAVDRVEGDLDAAVGVLEVLPLDRLGRGELAAHDEPEVACHRARALVDVVAAVMQDEDLAVGGIDAQHDFDVVPEVADVARYALQLRARNVEGHAARDQVFLREEVCGLAARLGISLLFRDDAVGNPCEGLDDEEARARDDQVERDVEVDDAVGDRAEALGDEGARCEQQGRERKRHGAPHRVGDGTAAADARGGHRGHEREDRAFDVGAERHPEARGDGDDACSDEA